MARGKLRLSAVQICILIELLPFYMPKVPAKDRTGTDLAAGLDKLERAKTRWIYQIEDLRNRPRDPRE